MQLYSIKGGSLLHPKRLASQPVGRSQS